MALQLILLFSCTVLCVTLKHNHLIAKNHCYWRFNSVPGWVVHDLWLMVRLWNRFICDHRLSDSSFALPPVGERHVYESIEDYLQSDNLLDSWWGTFPLNHTTYILTPYSRVLLEKLTGSAASQEIPRIFGTQRFLTVLTSACHLSLSSANSIQSPPPPPTTYTTVVP